MRVVIEEMSEHRDLELALGQAPLEGTRARSECEAVDLDHPPIDAELARRRNEALAMVVRLEWELATRGISDAAPMTPARRGHLLAVGADLERA